MSDFQDILPDTFSRADELIGWTVVDVWQDDEKDGDYEWGVGLVCERRGGRGRIWFSSIDTNDSRSFVCVDRRRGLWDHAHPATTPSPGDAPASSPASEVSS